MSRELQRERVAFKESLPIIFDKLILIKSFFSIFILNKFFVVVFIMMIHFLWLQIDILQAITLLNFIHINRIVNILKRKIFFGNRLSICILLNLYIILIIVDNIIFNCWKGFSFQIVSWLIINQTILVIIIRLCLIDFRMFPFFNYKLNLFVPWEINGFVASNIGF